MKKKNILWEHFLAQISPNSVLDKVLLQQYDIFHIFHFLCIGYKFMYTLHDY